MNFSRDQVSPLSIRRVEVGAVTIGDEVVRDNVVIFREELRRDIELSDAASLTEQDLESLLAHGPEVVIFGTGWQPSLPNRELTFALARRGIGFEAMDTAAACRTFNILLGEGRDVAAVLLIEESN